jgi:hypothetical protein
LTRHLLFSRDKWEPFMHLRFSRLLAILAGITGCAGVAHGQELREFCADRPGLGTPACTLDPGHMMLETGLGDWTRESDPQTRMDTFESGDFLLRFGIGESTELQAGWTAFGYARERDRSTGAIRHDSGTGDVMLAVRQNLHNPNGSGFSAAAMPYVTLPTGGRAIGAGTAGFGANIPLSYALSDSLSLTATPQIEAAADEDRHGWHLAYGSVIGLSDDLTSSISATVELQATRDDDPKGRATQTLASLSMAWQPKDNLQLDIGSVAGLNHNSPDAELYIGIARRF